MPFKNANPQCIEIYNVVCFTQRKQTSDNNNNIEKAYNSKFLY